MVKFYSIITRVKMGLFEVFSYIIEESHTKDDVVNMR